MGERRATAFLLLLALGGCTAFRRDQVHERLVRAYFADHPLRASREDLEAVWQSLPRQRELACAALSVPCRLESPAGADAELRCLTWFSDAACFEVRGQTEVTIVRQPGFLDRYGAVERWVSQQFDPDFADVDRGLADEALRKTLEEEESPFHPHSFYVATRVTFLAPSFVIGPEVQVGWRRWLQRSLVFALGTGYHHNVSFPTASGFSSDEVLVTARLELAWRPDVDEKRLVPPWLSGYFGLTTAVGFDDVHSVTTRGFIGFSAIIPFSIEVGYSVTTSAVLPLAGNLYLGVGLAL